MASGLGYAAVSKALARIAPRLALDDALSEQPAATEHHWSKERDAPNDFRFAH